MFTQKGLLFGVFVLLPASYVFNVMDNAGLVLNVAEGMNLPIFGTLAAGSFISGMFCVGMLLLSVFALGILPVMPGLDGSQEEKPVSLSDFNIHELQQMDREDELHHNREWKRTASASWDGRSSTPVYEDYRGYLRNAFTDEVICNNHTDKRRVVDGKVVRFGGKDL